MTVAGRSTAATIPHGAGRVARGSQHLRSWLVPVLLVGAVLACIATLALTTNPASIAPSARKLAQRPGLQSHSSTRLSVGLAAAASASIGASEHSFWPVRRGASLLTEGGGIHSTFTASGAALRVAQGTLGLSLAAVGRSQRLDPVAAVTPSASAGQVFYRHGSISEFYRNGPYGLEQGFSVRQRPKAGTGSLILALRVGGSLTPEQVGSQILFRTQAGAMALRYGQLRVLDAIGHRLPAHMQIRHRVLQLRVDDSSARYPLRIDPFIQPGSKLKSRSPESECGSSVALSQDGKFALIGCPGTNGFGSGGGVGTAGVGRAWVFTRSGSASAQTWSQTSVLVCCEGGEGGSEPPWRFGSSVALSADGKFALIGGPGFSGGAAWVFARSSTTSFQTWTRTGFLVPQDESGSEQFGSSVALSPDGKFALIGGPGFNGGDGAYGAAWVFRHGSTWTQQAKLTAGVSESGAADFGHSVALYKASDKNAPPTALIGGPWDNGRKGAAWVFRASDTSTSATWLSGKLSRPPDEIGTGEFGASVALSGDAGEGETALIGGPWDNGGKGAAWVFARPCCSWTQQVKLTTPTGLEPTPNNFGRSVALSSDGNMALIGETATGGSMGSAWTFRRRGSTWAQDGPSLYPSAPIGTDYFGSSVALSGDSTTALVGGPGDNSGEGAAWVFKYTLPTPWVVSLGDSYISGEAGRWAGNTRERPRSDTSGPASTDVSSKTYFDNSDHSGERIRYCHRSKSAEIHIGTDANGASLGSGVKSENLACSGATTRSEAPKADSGSDKGHYHFKPGLDFENKNYGQQLDYGGTCPENECKGQALMLEEFAAKNRVTLIAVSIGGNNFNFGEVVEKCLAAFNSPGGWTYKCRYEPSVSHNFTPENAGNKESEIRAALMNVGEAMANDGYSPSEYTILVQDYPSPMPHGSSFRYWQLPGWKRQRVGGCGFWDTDANYFNDTGLSVVDSTVLAAARGVGPNVETMDLEKAFNGRRLCENGLELLDGGAAPQSGLVDKTEWISQATAFPKLPFELQEDLHPNYWAQLALRNCLTQAYNSGTPRSGTCEVASQTGLTSAGEPNMVFR
jgi:hypothetical protein